MRKKSAAQQQTEARTAAAEAEAAYQLAASRLRLPLRLEVSFGSVLLSRETTDDGGVQRVQLEADLVATCWETRLDGSHVMEADLPLVRVGIRTRE